MRKQSKSGSTVAGQLAIMTGTLFRLKKNCRAGLLAAAGLTGSLALFVSFLLGASSAVADCSQSGTLTFTCSGDLSGGLVVQNEVPNSTRTVNVTDITVVPATTSIIGIDWLASSTTGAPANLNIDTGDLTLVNLVPVRFQSARTANFTFTGAATQSGTVASVGPVFLRGDKTNTVNATFDAATVTTFADALVDISEPISAVRIHSAREGTTNAAVNLTLDGDGLTAITTGNVSAGLFVHVSPRSGNAGQITITSSDVSDPAPLTITTEGDSSPGALLLSDGRSGVGSGSSGGQAGAVTVIGTKIQATTSGTASAGVVISSVGGLGIAGTSGDSGGSGGSAGATNLSGVFTIQTSGDSSPGLAVSSIGGRGGLAAGKGSAGTAGSGGFTSYVGEVGTMVQTSGDSAPGVSAQSIGGRGGAAGITAGLFTFAASGGSGGIGGTLRATSGGTISTAGNGSAGIELQTIGGGGGNGGSTFGLFYSKGGNGGKAGAGGFIEAITSSTSSITTEGNSAPGISAQTIGGTGGKGGSSAGMVALGGYASGTASGGDISIVHQGSISTGQGPSGEADASIAPCAIGCSYGILAQSIGGGGGNGGASAGWFSVGGAAAGGGGGGDVEVTTAGSVTTATPDSTGILAQSIGGGGGNGGASVAGGLFGAVAIGGSGGNGGKGGAVTVTANDGASLDISRGWVHRGSESVKV